MSKIQLKNVSNMNQGIPSGPLDGRLNMREAGALNESGMLDDSGGILLGGEEIYAGSESKDFCFQINNNGSSGNILFTLNYSWTQGSISGYPTESVITCYASNTSSNGNILQCNTPVITERKWAGRYCISVNCQISYIIQKKDSSGQLLFDTEGNPVSQLCSFSRMIIEDMEVEVISNDH